MDGSLFHENRMVLYIYLHYEIFCQLFTFYNYVLIKERM